MSGRSSRWIRVTDWAALTRVLASSAGRGTIRVNGKTQRARLEPRGRLFVYGYMRRRYGTRYLSWPPEWTGCAVEVGATARRSGGERLAHRLRLWARYVLRHTRPSVWDDVRAKATAVTEGTLWRLAAAVDGGTNADVALQQFGLPTDVSRYRTTTLRSEGAPEIDARDVQEAFTARQAFRVTWSGKYDCSARGERGPDGVYRPWLSTERRGLAHGHYWRLLDGTRAIFGESD